mmetsp:Transcript_24839/g.28529  ORF Transcript_24839/g.28529 Transcript_24839/m.28529 type:complete len:124 (+) Transcript_24839:859-1230(+)
MKLLLNKSYYGQGKKEIMNKIEKGYVIDELSLNKASGKQKKSTIGSTGLYNSYVIKMLSTFSDPYIKSKYDDYMGSHKRKKSPNTNVYSRMSKDVKRRETIKSNILINVSSFTSHRKNNPSEG